MFENICESIIRELYKLDEKYEKGTQLSGQDLKDIDLMAHALKGIAAYEAMKGESSARGRSRTTGRYISRDSGGYSGYDSRDGDSYESGRRYY